MRSLLNLKSSQKHTYFRGLTYGRIAAKESGCNLMPIKSIHEVNYTNIINFINDQISETKVNNQIWEDNELNIVIPMAGEGSRFKKAGFSFPKPLIEINQKPMIQVVIESLGLKGNYIFLVRKEHLEKYNLKNFLRLLVPKCKIVLVDKLTEGAACKFF